LLFATAALGSVACRTTILERSPPLDDGRSWLNGDPLSTAPPGLLLASALNALNRSSAEPMLEEIIRSQPASKDARGAHMLLSRIYLRTGRYHRMIANLDEWARRFPGDADLREEKTDVEQFRGLPDQVNGPVRTSELTHEGADDFSAPLSIDGKPANYLLDTGAWISVMTEQEAKRLGLEIRAGSGVLADASGKGVRIRTAVADEVTVGAMSFRQVSFAILPDVEPWRSMPEGRGGIIGIPVLLAMECIRWQRSGSWELGCQSDIEVTPRNMVFFENHLLARPRVPGPVFTTPVFTKLDTGAETTDLNSNFALQFKQLIERDGKKGTIEATGVGGTSVFESVTLPELAVDIGETRTTLRPAHVTLQKNPALGGRCCVGNLGLDLLRQTGDLTIDFRTMRLRLR
jgi:hypothetical protein